MEAGRGSLVCHDTSKEQPHVDGDRPPRTLRLNGGSVGGSYGGTGTAQRRLGRELQIDKRLRSSWEINAHFPSPPWRKMILGGRLALIPPHCPFFPGCASLPGHCLPHESSGPRSSITSSKKPSQMRSSGQGVTPLCSHNIHS